MLDIKKFDFSQSKITNVLTGWNVFAADWHPNGVDVLFIGQPKGRPKGSKNDLWVLSEGKEAPKSLTASFDYGIGGFLQPDMPVLEWYMPKFLFNRSGQYCYQMVQRGGNVEIYQICLDEHHEEVTHIVGGERSCVPMGISNDDHLVFAASTINSPGEIFRAKVDGSHEEQLTSLNNGFLAEKYLPKIDHLLFRGTDDVEVEGWFLSPSGAPPFPTVLYIHGGPHSGFGNVFSFDFQMLVGAGYGVLIINQRGSTGYGDAFATKILGDWGNHDYTDLMAGVDSAIAKGLADPDRLGVCGLSGGGNLTCWIIGHTDRFKAAIPENPVTNWVSFYGVSDVGPWFAVEELGGHPHEIPDIYSKCSPITYAHRCTTPTLLIQGESDHRCPSEQSEQFYTVLKVNGCITEMIRLPKSFHGGSIRGSPRTRNAQNEGLLTWLNKYVLGLELEE
jgi:dipeptidyl aminopeptidase/acylaminoacyl peptidase